MKRYSVSAFPSLHGTPVYTNSWLLSRVIALFRLVNGVREIRIIDHATNKHTVW